MHSCGSFAGGLPKRTVLTSQLEPGEHGWATAAHTATAEAAACPSQTDKRARVAQRAVLERQPAAIQHP